MPRACSASTNARKSSGVPKRDGRREEARDLVAPRARERVLHHRHQLDVGEAEVASRSRRAHPRARASRAPGATSPVHLVDRHRRARAVAAAAPRDPLVVAPLVATAEHDRRRSAAATSVRARDRIGVQARAAVGAVDRELVARARLDAGDEELPDARAAPSERIGCVRSSQPLKSPTSADRRARRAPTPRTRCRARRRPSRTCAPSTCPSSLVLALADEVEVELAERRQERVRIVEPTRRRAGYAHLVAR